MLQLNLNPFPVIETERLLLRRISMHDLADYFSLRNDAEAMKYLNKEEPQTIELIQGIINKIDAGIENNTAINWGISLKTNPTFIGSIGYHKIDLDHHRAEIGYMLQPAYWGQGITNEAIQAVIHFGFNNMQLHSMEAHINPENTASRNLLLKQGFVKEAYFKENYRFKDQFLDSEVLSLINPNA